jgi:hypothetical protein
MPNTAAATGRRGIHIMRARLRRGGSRLSPRGIPISAVGVAPPPAANPLPGVRPAAAEFAATPPRIGSGHRGDPQATDRGAPADYRVIHRSLLRSHLIVAAVAVSGMQRAVLNQFAQLPIFGVDSAHALEFNDLLIMDGGRRRMDSLECFHSHRLRARGAREPCFRAQNSTPQLNVLHELAVWDFPLGVLSDRF